jgi:alanine-glyoxylate transaminase/serine-glyoxylate transaminase/serine-pyruvate transaminase
MKDRTLLMIPGPIEFEPAVLAALDAPTTNHIAHGFIHAFGQALVRMRLVFLCPVWALDVSLGQILEEGLDARFRRHRALSRAAQQAIAALGLGRVPVAGNLAAHTMTAPRYPAGVAGSGILTRIGQAGAVLAKGRHPEIMAEYFRIGHVGPTNMGDLLATIGALEVGFAACGCEFEPGVGVAGAAAA